MKIGTKDQGCLMVIGGILLSGQSTNWGARAAGHDPRAGYPFPDLLGLGLFLLGVTIIPLGVAIAVALIRHFSRKRFGVAPLSTATAILIFAPLIGWGIGYRVQLPYSRALAEAERLNALKSEAYTRYVAQITENPEIVLRERWFEWDDTDRSGARASARWDVFERSFRPKPLKVPYTVDQLRRIYEESPFSRPMVAAHPLCPPELIESIWPTLFSHRDVSMIERVIKNPATPRRLLEEYQIKRGHGHLQSPHSMILDHAVEQRLRN